MKKAIFIIIIGIFILFELRSQNCTNCSSGNLINFTNYSSALGIDNKSWGLGSLAAGKYDTVTGNHSVGFGFRANVSGETSFAAGGIVNSSGIGSMSFGHYLHASGTKSFVIGTGGSSTGILTNDIVNSLKVGFGSYKSTLFISTAPEDGKTGEIGIGDVTSPSAKLHLKSDYGEDAVLLVEPNQWNSDGWAEVRIGNNANALRGSYTYGLQFKTDKNYIFNSAHANVGIGTLNPTELLEVNGNIKQSAGFNIVSSSVKAPDINGLKLYDYTSNGITIKNSGKVGIGVTSPMEKLEVAGNIKQGYGYRTITPEIRAVDANGLKLFNSTGTGITINNSGNVGIGVTSPMEKLEVAGNIKQGYGYRTLTPEIRAVDANGLKLFNSTGTGITINNSGYVGIGTTPTSNRLEVAGTVNATNFTGNGSGLDNVTDYRWDLSYYNSITTNGSVILGYSNFTETEVTEITDPQFEVRSIAENNRKSANFVDSAGRTIFFVPLLTDWGYNPISSENDAGIFWSDGLLSGHKNQDAGFVIAPHSDSLAKGIKIDKDGNVGIGKPVPTAKLDVAGELYATSIEAENMYVEKFETDTLKVFDKLWAGEIEVTNITDWKDNVFSDNYNLMTLLETEEYIKAHHHLPGIPSESEVMQNGINVGEMNALLLQKIEELTLYIIMQEKRILNLEKQLK